MFKLDVLERFHKDVKREFRPSTSVKINRSEMDLLLVLSRVAEKSFRFYGRHIHLEKSSFSYVVDLLTLKDLVSKEENEQDKRRKSLKLTSKGEQIVNELKEQYEAYYENRMSIFNSDELTELETAVKTIDELSQKLRRHMDSKGERDELKRHKHRRV